jgi:hypothetical protein
MPPGKPTTATLDTKGAKIGEPIAKAIVDTNTASVGIPPQPAYDLTEEISALRKQIDTLRKQVADATQAVNSGTSQAARKTQATAAPRVDTDRHRHRRRSVRLGAFSKARHCAALAL